MSVLAPALLDSLRRLLPPPPTARLDAAAEAALEQVVTALAAALERGELALDLEGAAPDRPPKADAVAQGNSSAAANADASAQTSLHAGSAAWPALHLAALEACGWLVEATALDSQSEQPVVRDGRWLRWRRWHQQLSHCTTALIDRAQAALEPAPTDAERRQASSRAAAAGLDAQQCGAVAALLQHRLVLLSGGPGTGKTSTVVQMLAAALHRDPELRLQLAAPTGKAAARLGTAVAEGAAALEQPLAQRLQQLPCGTLHRLLEARGDGTGFRRGRSLPLALDLLVVDEVSMVDLPLMEALLAALPEHARLLLVGDPGQLPPVGPGAVLLELCRPEHLAALGTAAVELRTTYRNNGAIAALAAELRHSDQQGPPLLDGLRPRLRQLATGANVRWQEAAADRPPREALERLREHQQRLAQLATSLGTISALREDTGPSDITTISSSSAAALLAELERLILLSPIRQGPWGVEGVHRALLGDVLRAPLLRWPLGTPVLNRRNLPEQGLANGDIGVVVASDDGGRLVLFPGGRLLHPARLGQVEPALALTVHKAQGSQYGELLLLLPAVQHLEARLIYTGLTRARLIARLYIPRPVGEPLPAVASGAQAP